jgi:hypothetical protein
LQMIADNCRQRQTADAEVERQRRWRRLHKDVSGGEGRPRGRGPRLSRPMAAASSQRRHAHQRAPAARRRVARVVFVVALAAAAAAAAVVVIAGGPLELRWRGRMGAVAWTEPADQVPRYLGTYLACPPGESSTLRASNTYTHAHALSLSLTLTPPPAPPHVLATHAPSSCWLPPLPLTRPGGPSDRKSSRRLGQSECGHRPRRLSWSLDSGKQATTAAAAGRPRPGREGYTVAVAARCLEPVRSFLIAMRPATRVRDLKMLP